MLAGSGLVKAYSLAAATASAMVLNSPTGVMFPGTSTAPPITRICLARRNVFGPCAAAVARVVRGPMAMRVIVSAGSVLRMRRISRCEGKEEGVNKLWWFEVGGSVWVAEAAVEVKRVPGGGGSKR